MSELQPHIKCKKGDIAKIVFLPGDPRRIDKIIKLWDESHEVAYNREFRVFTGVYKGIPVSAVSTGVGSPSAAIAVEELANIGAEIFIRIGTCGGLKKEIKAGDLIVPYAAIRAEGTTREYLPPEFPAVADMEIVSSLTKASKELNVKFFTGVNRTHDAFYEPHENLNRWSNLYKDERMKNWNLPLVSSEMECSAVFLIAAIRGLKAGAVLAVNTEEPLDNDGKEEDMYELIENAHVTTSIDRAIAVAHKAIEILNKKQI
jgi:uridine phosphorylase